MVDQIIALMHDRQFMTMLLTAIAAGATVYTLAAPMLAGTNLNKRMKAVAEGEPEFRKLSGLEAWFEPAVVPATMHPPRARMALVTWLGIFPTVSFFLWFVLPWIQPLPFLPRTAVLTALIVVTMTWVVMPRLTRVLRGFLNPPRKG